MKSAAKLPAWEETKNPYLLGKKVSRLGGYLQNLKNPIEVWFCPTSLEKYILLYRQRSISSTPEKYIFYRQRSISSTPEKYIFYAGEVYLLRRRRISSTPEKYIFYGQGSIYPFERRMGKTCLTATPCRRRACAAWPDAVRRRHSLWPGVRCLHSRPRCPADGATPAIRACRTPPGHG